uniref:Uncharacterized protein n=1 Tax=Triticum urartu TaxID=4572 RepID=A0A8R7NZD0_TRIUA
MIITEETCAMSRNHINRMATPSYDSIGNYLSAHIPSNPNNMGRKLSISSKPSIQGMSSGSMDARGIAVMGAQTMSTAPASSP